MSQNQLKYWDEKTYLTLGQDELLIAALSSSDNKGGRVTFEHLVAQCFSLFPRKFELKGYPNWPNAVIVNKSWLRCRSDKRLVEGSVSDGFILTPKGIEYAKKVFSRLGVSQDKSMNQAVEVKRGDRQTAAGHVVKHVETSKAYMKYKQNKSFEQISEHELCELLYAMIESDAETLIQNFEVIKQHVTVYKRGDLVNFLEGVRRHFIWRFSSRKRKNGMLPQKPD